MPFIVLGLRDVTESVSEHFHSRFCERRYDIHTNSSGRAEAAAAPAAAAAERGRALQILGSDRVGNAIGGQDTADVGLTLHVHHGDQFLAVEDRQHNTAPFLKMEFSAFILPQAFPARNGGAN